MTFISVVFPVITRHGSLPALISRLRESYPFFDSVCSTVSYIFHNDIFQTLLLMFFVAYIAWFIFRFLHYSFGIGSLDRDRNKSFLYQFIIDVFFEEVDLQTDKMNNGGDSNV